MSQTQLPTESKDVLPFIKDKGFELRSIKQDKILGYVVLEIAVKV